MNWWITPWKFGGAMRRNKHNHTTFDSSIGAKSNWLKHLLQWFATFLFIPPLLHYLSWYLVLPRHVRCENTPKSSLDSLLADSQNTRGWFWYWRIQDIGDDTNFINWLPISTTICRHPARCGNRRHSQLCKWLGNLSWRQSGLWGKRVVTTLCQKSTLLQQLNKTQHKNHRH